MSSMGRSSGNTAPGEIGNDPEEYPEHTGPVRDVPRGRRAARMGSSTYPRTRRTGRAHRVLPAAGPAAPGLAWIPDARLPHAVASGPPPPPPPPPPPASARPVATAAVPASPHRGRRRARPPGTGGAGRGGAAPRTRGPLRRSRPTAWAAAWRGGCRPGSASTPTSSGSPSSSWPSGPGRAWPPTSWRGSSSPPKGRRRRSGAGPWRTDGPWAWRSPSSPRWWPSCSCSAPSASASPPTWCGRCRSPWAVWSSCGGAPTTRNGPT